MNQLVLDNYINTLSNKDAEQIVLGAMLLDKNVYYSQADNLFEELFTQKMNQFVFRALREVVESGAEIDIITVSQQCRNAGYSELCKKEDSNYNLIAYIPTLTNAIGSSSHVEQHIGILTEYYVLRKLQLMTIDVSQRCMGLDSTKDIIAHINTQIVEIININDEEFDKQDAIRKTLYSMEQQSIEHIIRSGIHALDNFIFGFELSDLIIVAGAASMGKTAFALRLFLNFIDADMYPAIFSLEMSEQQMLSRLLSMKTNVSLSNIRKRSLDAGQWNDMNQAAAQLLEKNFNIDDSTGNLNQIANKIRKYKIKFGTKIFFVDYLQLVKVQLGKGSNREQEIATISRTFKELCRDLKVIIIALSQLNRDVSKRSNHRPMLSDLRESGAIEQDADFVLFPYRPAYYDNFETTIPYKEDATLIIAKGRGTGIQDIPMHFISTRTNYLNGDEIDDHEIDDQTGTAKFIDETKDDDDDVPF